MLSRLPARVKTHTNALDQKSLMDLYFTLPHTCRAANNLRGKLRHGLCDLCMYNPKTFVCSIYECQDHHLYWAPACILFSGPYP